MMRVSVDEAYAYDMLSILEVKNIRLPSDAGARSFELLSEELRQQAGDSFHDEILRSPEYAALVKINAALFDALEMIKRSDKHFEGLVDGEWPHTFTAGEWPGAAHEIDRMVYKRYLCKRALQARFFGHTPLTERKIGYQSST